MHFVQRTHENTHKNKILFCFPNFCHVSHHTDFCLSKFDDLQKQRGSVCKGAKHFTFCLDISPGDQMLSIVHSTLSLRCNSPLLVWTATVAFNLFWKVLT